HSGILAGPVSTTLDRNANTTKHSSPKVGRMMRAHNPSPLRIGDLNCGRTYGSTRPEADKYNQHFHASATGRLMDNGYVYVLSNATMPGLLKIGKTTRSSDERARELSRSTSVPSRFVVEYEIFSPAASELE